MVHLASTCYIYEGDGALSWIKEGDIAVPTSHLNEITQTAPNRPPNKNEIDIEMSAVELIGFNVKMQQFTIRMDLIINWPEKRLKLVKSSLVNGWIRASLGWYPQIDIRSDVVSESRNENIFEVKMDSQSKISKWRRSDTDIQYLVQSLSAKMTISLTTTVRCGMSFGRFPFDSHTCKLEVSLKSTNVVSILGKSMIFLPLQNKSYSISKYVKV